MNFQAVKLTEKSSVQIGQVWSTKAIHQDVQANPTGSRNVIVVDVDLEGGNIITVIPLSDNWGLASQEDLILNPTSGMPVPLNKWAMAELWAESNILADSIDHFFGSVSRELFNTIQTLRNWVLNFEEYPVEADLISLLHLDYFGTKFVAEKWSFLDPVNHEMYEVILGREILTGGDLRVEFHEFEYQDMKYLEIPYMRTILAEI